MPPLNKALVVGGGLGGMTAALQLARLGVDVELAEIDPDWRSYGAGITITGPSLRAFQDLGILEEIRARGFVGGGLRLVSLSGQPLPGGPPAADGDLLHSTGGILRSDLHDILARRERGSAVQLRLGVGLETVTTEPDAAEVSFTDGSRTRYDLVVAADGIYSRVRQQLFPETPPPRLTGQGCWRVVAQRPADMATPEIFIGGPVKLGLVPISAERLYMFILEHVPDNPRYATEQYIPHLRRLMASYGGHAAEVRDGLGPGSMINYRPLEWMMVARPWYRGRVLLIGDAAHATTPHMASGAGLAVEDGIVLTLELAAAGTVEQALASFMERRFERARIVVENSVRIGEIEIAGENPMGGAIVMGQTMAAIQAPY